MKRSPEIRTSVPPMQHGKCTPITVKFPAVSMHYISLDWTLASHLPCANMSDCKTNVLHYQLSGCTFLQTLAAVSFSSQCPAVQSFLTPAALRILEPISRHRASAVYTVCVTTTGYWGFEGVFVFIYSQDLGECELM